VSPFDPKSVILAKHAQHVVLIHFPIALFIVGTGFDVVADMTRKSTFAAVAYYNLLLAALSTLPVVITGLLAWHFALEGAPLKGILRYHLVGGLASTFLILMVTRMHYRAQKMNVSPSGWRLPLEALTVLLIGLTAHLGGFLSGVNS
jgi:uncharacterized membrane protein